MVIKLGDRVDSSANKLLAEMLAEVTPHLRRRIRNCPICHKFFFVNRRKPVRGQIVKYCSRKCGIAGSADFKRWSFIQNVEIFTKPCPTGEVVTAAVKTVLSTLNEATVASIAKAVEAHIKTRVTHRVTEQALWTLRAKNEVTYNCDAMTWRMRG